MRLRAALFAVIVLAGAGYAAWTLAGAATAWYEHRSAAVSRPRSPPPDNPGPASRSTG